MIHDEQTHWKLHLTLHLHSQSLGKDTCSPLLPWIAVTSLVVATCGI